jgi:hypothetical protein
MALARKPRTAEMRDPHLSFFLCRLSIELSLSEKRFHIHYPLNTKYYFFWGLVPDWSSNQGSKIIIQDVKFSFKYYIVSNFLVLQLLVFKIFTLKNRKLSFFMTGTPLNGKSTCSNFFNLYK